MKKKAYLKDCRKMFKNNFTRFISIVLIIILGTAFFVGMNAVAPAMEDDAEKYMKENNIFDISLSSNLGYKEEDIEKFKEDADVKEIQGVFLYDVLTLYDKKDVTLRLFSSDKESDINKSKILDGRNIEKDNECLICSRLKDMYGYNIGDKIKVYRTDDTNLDDYIKYTEYEIVGVAQNPAYISKFYGNTTLLTGELNSYIIVDKQVFNMKDYTTVYIKLDIDENINKFSDEYKKELEDKLDKIKSIDKEIAQNKFDKLYKEKEKEVLDYASQIEKTEQYIEKLYSKINASQKEIDDNIVNVSKAVSQYYHSEKIYIKMLERKNTLFNLYSDLDTSKIQKSNLEKDINTLKPKVINLRNELESLNYKIEKNLYELYSLNDEETRFVEINKELNEMYYEYNSKNNEYKNLNTQYENKLQQYENTKENVSNIESQIKEKQLKLYNSFTALEDLIGGINNPELVKSVQIIKTSQEKLNDKIEQLDSKNIKPKIQNAKEELAKASEELNQFKIVETITPLYENTGFKSLKEDLSKIAIMGKIFPVMFFVVAALVTITTISRMIEKDRSSLGTLKALGYKKTTIMTRYIIYSLSAAILGTLIGALIGSILIVQILFVSYGSLYDLPDLETNINILYTSVSLIIALISTVLVTVILTLKALKENAAELMRPKTVKKVKGIFLEKIPFIWKNLSFLFKICFRNIFRYKQRLLMTIIGIAGCTALIYSGLGLQSSINEISDKQFKDIRKLSLEVYLQKELEEEKVNEIKDFIKEQEYIKDLTPIMQKTFTVGANENKKDVFYIVADANEIHKYIGLQTRNSQEEIELNDDGVILTEKLANILEIKVGEKIKIIVADGIESTVKVIGITENYLYNYVYMTPKMYERVYGNNIQYNAFFANVNKELSDDEEVKLANKLKENENISAIIIEKNLNKEFQTSLTSLMSIVILFVGCASLLSFTVLINLNNINIEERTRELSTIKLLGFYKKELESYVFRENIILTILGTVLGLGLGIGILGHIIQSAEVETIFLSKDISIINLGIASLMTLLFTLITNWIMKKKLKNINMIDSLKSVE